MAMRCLAITACLLVPLTGVARMPLFDAAGYRIADYRAPVPETAPAGRIVSAREVEDLQRRGAVLLDVMGLRHYRIGDDGRWSIPEPHLSLRDAVWLPVVGWGQLEPWQQVYLEESLEVLTGGDKAKPLVVFCMLDCWLSWNTVKRLAAAGHSELYWFAGGIEEWADSGHELIPLEPYRAVTARPAKRGDGVK